MLNGPVGDEGVAMERNKRVVRRFVDEVVNRGNDAVLGLSLIHI